MKNIKSFKDFINEELKHLPPPSDDETFGVEPIKRINLINSGQLDKKFYPTEKEILKSLRKIKLPEEELIKSTRLNLLAGVKDAIKRGANIDIGEDFEINDEDEDDENYGEISWTMGMSSLMIASEKGYFDIVKYLVEHGANIDGYTEDNGMDSNWTPLYYAIVHGHTEIIKFLVENDASVDQFILDVAKDYYFRCGKRLL